MEFASLVHFVLWLRSSWYRSYWEGVFLVQFTWPAGVQIVPGRGVFGTNVMGQAGCNCTGKGCFWYNLQGGHIVPGRGVFGTNCTG